MKLVILDRDGVINQESDAFVKNPDEWVALSGSLQAIARLSQAGWTVVVATNQSGLARGLFDVATLNAIHAKMHDELAKAGGVINAVFLCPHGPTDGCACRKPLPGLFLDIARRYNVDLTGVPCLGDSLRDLQAAAAAGCAPWLALTGNGLKTRDQGGLPPGTQICDGLPAFADALLSDGAAMTPRASRLPAADAARPPSSDSGDDGNDNSGNADKADDGGGQTTTAGANSGAKE